MVGLCQEVDLQMALQNALGKGVVLLTSIPLHGGTVPHLQSARLVGFTITVEEICMKGIMIGKV